MLPVSWPIVVAYLVGYAVVGAAIGTFTGSVVALIARNRPIRPLKHAILGSVGFLIAFVGVTLMPWPRNTIYRVASVV